MSTRTNKSLIKAIKLKSKLDIYRIRNNTKTKNWIKLEDKRISKISDKLKINRLNRSEQFNRNLPNHTSNRYLRTKWQEDKNNIRLYRTKFSKLTKREDKKKSNLRLNKESNKLEDMRNIKKNPNHSN